MNEKPDLTTVMSWLEGLTEDDWKNFYSYSEVQSTAKAALELLKEPEAVEPILVREGKSKMYNDYRCPICNQEIVYEQNYCCECGKAMKWE